MAAPAKLVSTSIGFQDAKGNVVANGMLMLTLSQTATVTATGGQVTIEPIYLNLDANGKITSTAIWFQDELSPSGTIYYGVVYASNKMRVIPGLDKLQYSITGASYDLATAVQSAAASPSYSGAVLLTPTADQTITQNNLLPGTDNAQSLGSAVKRWIGQFAALTALTLNKITFTQPATSATLTLVNNTVVTGPSASDTLVGKATTDTLTNKTLTSASNGNTVTILQPLQATTGTLTGTGADANIYTDTINANTVATNKCLRILFSYAHLSGTATVTYKVKLNAVTVISFTDAGVATTGNFVAEFWVTGSTTANFRLYGVDTGTVARSAFVAVTGLAWTSSQALAITFSVANTDTVKGQMYAGEISQ